MQSCPVTTKARVTTAVCLLLALYVVLWFYVIGDADSRYFSVHIVGSSLPVRGQGTKQSSISLDPNKVTESNELSDVLTAVTDESHPQGSPTLQHSTAISSTTGVPTTHKTAVTDTELTAQSEIEIEPVPGQRHIIFLETRCVLNDSTAGNQLGLVISKREACAVASAANTNPDTTVYLLYTCSVAGKLSDSPEYVRQMLSYHNVRIWKLVVADYIKGTPLENWDFIGKVRSSKWSVSHASDILRYTTLWKYGGTYLDLDFVMQKSLAGLGTNYAGAQAKNEMASGALNFDMDAAGRTTAHLCLMDVQKNFNGHQWTQNGPLVIHRVLQILCGTISVTNTTREQCAGFNVLPPSVFYAISYPSWRLLFDESKSNSTLKKVESSLGVHVWNTYSSKEKITVGSKQAYGLLAQKYCPGVYSNSGTEF